MLEAHDNATVESWVRARTFSKIYVKMTRLLRLVFFFFFFYLLYVCTSNSRILLTQFVIAFGSSADPCQRHTVYSVDRRSNSSGNRWIYTYCPTARLSRTSRRGSRHVSRSTESRRWFASARWILGKVTTRQPRYRMRYRERRRRR